MTPLPPYDPAWSDGCTWPAPDLGPAVRACCLLHDAAYYGGGTVVDFLHANLSLGSCIATTEHAAWAWVFASATTLGGWLFFRWRRPTPRSTRTQDHREST